MSRRKSGHLTSREIALAAGVSQATVSNVLNRPQVVAPDTQARVRAAMDSLGFVVNGSARSLRAGTSRTIGVVALDLSNPFWGEVTRGIEATASAHGYSLLIGASNERLDKELDLLRLFAEHRVDGILVSTVDQDSTALRTLHSRGTKVVFLDEVDARSRYASVAFNHVRGAKLAAEYLVGQGHRRLAFINGPHAVPWCRARSEGFRVGIDGSGQGDVHLAELTINSMTAQEAEPAVERMLRTTPRVTGVFCVNDMVALGVLKELSRRGLRVPRDISLVGFDDSYFSSLLSPALTTVRQEPYLLGQRAAELVMRPQQEGSPTSVLFEPQLMVRESVRRLKSRSPLS